MKALIYDLHSGAIDRVYVGPESLVSSQLEQGEGWVEDDPSSTASDATHYVDVVSGEVREKQPLDLSHSVNELTIELPNLPAGVVVYVKGSEFVTDAEPTTIQFELPGVYRMTIIGGTKYLDDSLEVTIG